MIAVGASVPDALANASVIDAQGGARRLGDAWRDRDAIVIFVRHFACGGCMDHIAELRPRLEEILALGVACVVVGNGSPLQLAGFVERWKLAGHPVELVTDPSLASYAAAGLERSLMGTIGPRAVANIIALAARGRVNGLPHGDLSQQGGTLYVRRGGELAFHHRSKRVGDHAPVARVVELAIAAHIPDAAGLP